jgi:excisionase family DNA binding protein
MLLSFFFASANRGHTPVVHRECMRMTEETRMDDALLFSIQDAAKALGIGRSKAYHLISQGRLLTVHIGRRRLVRVDSVKALAAGEAA